MERITSLTRLLEDAETRVREVEGREASYSEHIRELTSSMRTLSNTVVALKRTANLDAEEAAAARQKVQSQLADQSAAHQDALRELRAHMRQVRQHTFNPRVMCDVQSATSKGRSVRDAVQSCEVNTTHVGIDK